MVRVGIYETIPGYSITHIKFYAYDTDGNFKVSEGNNIILTSATDGYFVGGSNLTGTVTYDWKSTTPSYTYAYNETGLTKSKNWYAGKLEVLAENHQKLMLQHSMVKTTICLKQAISPYYLHKKQKHRLS